MKHTDGPWEVSPQPGQRTFIVAGEEAIAEVFVCPFHEQDKANAQLIASSPMLFKVMRQIAEVAADENEPVDRRLAQIHVWSEKALHLVSNPQ